MDVINDRSGYVLDAQTEDMHFVPFLFKKVLYVTINITYSKKDRQKYLRYLFYVMDM